VQNAKINQKHLITAHGDRRVSSKPPLGIEERDSAGDASTSTFSIQDIQQTGRKLRSSTTSASVFYQLFDWKRRAADRLRPIASSSSSSSDSKLSQLALSESSTSANEQTGSEVTGDSKKARNELVTPDLSDWLKRISLSESTDSSVTQSPRALSPIPFELSPSPSPQPESTEASPAAPSSPANMSVPDNQPPQPPLIQPRPAVPDIFAPRPFRGLTEDNPEEWWDIFTAYVDARGLSATEKVNFFTAFLRDSAADWFRALQPTDRDTMTNIEKKFKEHYVPTAVERAFDAESVFSRSQKPREKVRDYVAIMQRLAARMENVTPEILRMLIMRGFRPAIKRHVIQQATTTLDDVIKAARAAELSEHLVQDDNDGKLDALMTQVQALGKQLAPRVASSMDQRSPTPERRRVTFSTRQSPEQQPTRDTAAGRPGQFRCRGQGQAQQQRQPYQPTCDRCGRSSCFGGNRCIAVSRQLTCYSCGLRGHLSVVCRRGRRAGAQPFRGRGRGSFSQ